MIPFTSQYPWEFCQFFLECFKLFYNQIWMKYTLNICWCLCLLQVQRGNNMHQMHMVQLWGATRRRPLKSSGGYVMRALNPLWIFPTLQAGCNPCRMLKGVEVINAIGLSFIQWEFKTHFQRDSCIIKGYLLFKPWIYLSKASTWFLRDTVKVN